MILHNQPRPHLLFLFSDTGGGHRSATEAIIEALNLEYQDCVTTDMVDIFKDYAPAPLNLLPRFYPKIVRLPQAWELGYKLSNGHRRARLITASAWPYVRRSIRTLVGTHPSNLIISVHPLATAPVLRALGSDRPPFITVVTDLVTTHALWYHRRTDLCLVPTKAAMDRAIKFGLRQEQVQVVGLPVADRFCKPAGDRSSLRSQLGWLQDRVLVILVGGGEGMGPGKNGPGDSRSGVASLTGGYCRKKPGAERAPGKSGLAGAHIYLRVCTRDARLYARRRIFLLPKPARER